MLEMLEESRIGVRKRGVVLEMLEKELNVKRSRPLQTETHTLGDGSGDRR